jgi:hypothetical protein
MRTYNFLAFDLGATSGRAILGTLGGGKLETKELTRLVGVYNHIGLFCRYSHRGNTEDNCQDKKVFFHSDRIIQFVDKKFCIQQR